MSTLSPLRVGSRTLSRPPTAVRLPTGIGWLNVLRATPSIKSDAGIQVPSSMRLPFPQMSTFRLVEPLPVFPANGLPRLVQPRRTVAARAEKQGSKNVGFRFDSTFNRWVRDDRLAGNFKSDVQTLTGEVYTVIVLERAGGPTQSRDSNRYQRKRTPKQEF